MEVAALAGLLAVGYALTKGRGTEQIEEEGFDNELPSLANGGLPPPLYNEDKTSPGAPTVPGKPRQPRPTADGDLDLYYRLPSGGSLSSSPATQPDLYPRSMIFSTPAQALAPQAPMTSVTQQVRMNVDGTEAPPIYNSGKTVISPLSGLPVLAEEFTHNNMVPFYRGSLKQNMSDVANRGRLDDMIGSGSTDIGKREQAPLFDPHREPTGNVNGLESITDFVHDRMVAPTSRAGEVPVEPTRVGPGLNQGFTPFPTGGFQQFDIDEIMKQRKSVDELRVESNPKITYEGQVIAGKALATQRGDIGEVRKYRPDTFFLNEHGERNFVTAGENTKPTERPAQVMKFQAREETTGEAFGPAGASDFSATYTVPSFRAPMAQQHDGFGLRNADGSTYGVKNTDAANNDFGRAGYDLPVNQRNVTSERGQGLNLTVAGAPKALTVYDPNDVARTTIRESTGANDWVGIAAPASSATKLTVYDPTDITRITHRNTMTEPDRAMNVTRAGVPGQGTLQVPDGVRATTKAAISAKSDYTGSAGAYVSSEQVYDYAYSMRQNPTKEVVASGRRPVAGNGSLGLFNGEDYMNVTHRRLDTDSLNDRATSADRVIGPPLGAEAIGLQRPKQTLKLDVAADRNISEILDSLSENPYALPVHKIAAGLPVGGGQVAMAAMSIGGGW
jgi:hypothetical protein